MGGEPTGLAQLVLRKGGMICTGAFTGSCQSRLKAQNEMVAVKFILIGVTGAGRHKDAKRDCQ